MMMGHGTVREKEYALPVGIPGLEEYGLRISFFDSGGIGRSVYPYEEEPPSPESSGDSSSPNGGS